MVEIASQAYNCCSLLERQFVVLFNIVLRLHLRWSSVAICSSIPPHFLRLMMSSIEGKERRKEASKALLFHRLPLLALIPSPLCVPIPSLPNAS